MATLAAVQFKASKGDWTQSAGRLESLLEEDLGTRSGGNGSAAGIVVCPEMALTGYVFPDREAAAEVAEPAGGRTFEFASRMAKRSQSIVVIGYPESGEDGELYNSALVVSPEGELLYNYRKRLLYDTDTTWATPGNTPYPLLETPWGVLTCGICMDLNDEEFIGFLFEQGPDLIAFPTNWLDQGFDVRLYWRWRLAGYPGWLIAANTHGTEEGIPFRGHSAILDPAGRTAAIAPKHGDVVIRTS